MKELWGRLLFIWGILIAIFLALLFPSIGASGGVLYSQYTSRYVAVFLIFLIFGYTIKTEDLYQGATEIHILLFVQIFSFLVMPFLVLIFTLFLRKMNVNEWITKGLLTVSCMPPPISSAVILTRSAGGNVPAAFFNSVIGCLIGIFFTPFALLMFLGTTSIPQTLLILKQLIFAALFPLFLGQFLQNAIMKLNVNDSRILPYLNVMPKLSLLYIIYASFCDTFEKNDFAIGPIDILITVLLVILMQIVCMWIVFTMISYKQDIFKPADAVTALFCSSQKSLTVGLAILRILFGGYEHLSTISFPLIIYHPIQIILGSLAADHLANWVARNIRNLLPK